MKPGYWCECHTTTDANDRAFSASFDAYSPQQAVRWIRVAVRTIASALDEPADRAWQWILTDHTHAVHELSLGHPYALTLKHRTTALTWTARPVLYVPLAHRNGHQLPPCAERFSTAQHHDDGAE